MLRAFVHFLTQLLLWTLVAQANHALGGWHVYLFVGGLFVTHAALTFSLRDGLVAAALGGFLFDATTPVPFGLHALLFAAAVTLIVHLRDRLPHDETAARVVIALLANLAIFLVFSFTQISRLPAPAAAWPRLIWDLVCSQIFLALVAPWFLALQGRALVLARTARAEPA